VEWEDNVSNTKYEMWPKDPRGWVHARLEELGKNRGKNISQLIGSCFKC
jgi:hypothetical protein